jgi:sulfite reductase (ferredoxin)
MQAELGAKLEPLFAAFAAGRQANEGFGDFCRRLGLHALLDLITAAVPAAAE